MELSFIDNAVKIGEEIHRIKDKHYHLRIGSRRNFNFFEGIVRVGLHHEKYHSNFIAYLLNPDASHDCGDFFLKKFLIVLSSRICAADKNLDCSFLNNLENVVVQREKERIDIAIEKGTEWIIFIENKVRHQERAEQLQDYYNNCVGKYCKAVGVFLTKTGEAPTSIVIGRDSIFNFSYAEQILDWLQVCYTDVELLAYPHIISSLIQYSEIIKRELNIMEDKVALEIRGFLEKDTRAVISLLGYKKEIHTTFDQLDAIIGPIRVNFLDKVVECIKAELTGVAEMALENIVSVDGDKIERKLYYKIAGYSLILDVGLNFPHIEDDGRGLWWGIYDNNGTPVDAGLENNCWETFVINNNVQDYWDADNGSAQIYQASLHPSQYETLIQSTAHHIVTRFRNTTLPIIKAIVKQ